MHVTTKEIGDDIVSSVLCKVCNKSYCFGQKEGRPMISNWTKHIIKCVLTAKRNTGVTRTLHQYLLLNEAPTSRPSSNATASDISTFHNDRFSTDVEKKNSTERTEPEAGTVEEKDHHFRLSPPT